MSSYYIYCKKADFKKISETFHISPMLARILRNRDLVSEREIEEYLNGGTDRLNDPFLIKGIEEAVPLILRAVRKKEHIRIVGDYDTDGVCASYILKEYLTMIGGCVDVRLPDRMAEGYGMNPDMVREAARDGVDLIITCDNGVSSYDAVEAARSLKIRVIISDHHEVPLPLIGADVLIDAKQPGDTSPCKDLCGAAVAYKIVSALNAELERRLKGSEKASGLLAKTVRQLDDLLQFAGIATVADVVPLTGENRIFAKEGIRRLKTTKNKGLLALMRVKQIEVSRVSSYHIGFILAPCLNSAGRLKNAELALKLLEEKDLRKAGTLAEELSLLNEERKQMTAAQTLAAEAMADQIRESEGALPKILVLYLKEAHESIAGIIAGRLKEIYSRPAIIVTDSEDGYKGSGRSVDALNLIEELKKHDSLFRKLGGHAKAAGFSLAESVTAEILSRRLNESCDLSEEALTEKKWIDMQLPFQYVSEAFVKELELLEPFGLMNERPVFAERNVKVNRVSVLGKNNNVLKLQLENETGVLMEGIHYGSEERIAAEAEKLISGKEEQGEAFRIALTYYPSVNAFRGVRSVQIRILEFLSVSQRQIR